MLTLAPFEDFLSSDMTEPDGDFSIRLWLIFVTMSFRRSFIFPSSLFRSLLKIRVLINFLLV